MSSGDRWNEVGRSLEVLSDDHRTRFLSVGFSDENPFTRSFDGVCCDGTETATGLHKHGIADTFTSAIAMASAPLAPPLLPPPAPPLPPPPAPPQPSSLANANLGKAIQQRRAMERAHAIEVRAVKTPEGHVGVGVMVMDPLEEEKVLWQESKYVGQGMSWHVAEYSGLLDAMAAAERLGVQVLRARLSSRVVSDQVNGFWKPKLANQWRLLSQVRTAMQNFSSFQISPWPKGSSNVAVDQLAKTAVSSHLAGDSSSSSAGASTSGAIENVKQQNETLDASTSADPLNARRANKENCVICFEDKSSNEMMTLKKCVHKFCNTCLQRHAEVQVQASQVPVRCPQAGCPDMLEYEECRRFLSPTVFTILTKRLIEARVPEGDRVYCPYANCSALMDKSGLGIPEQGSSAASSQSSVYQKVDCVACKHSFCLDCRVPWHWNRSCQEYQSLPPDLRDVEESNLYKLAQNEKWQRCNKCRRMIELAEGCYHMTCRCGCEFCYTCGTEWKNKRQQCQCKLWDERNIVRMPLDSDDESDDDDDMYDFLDADDDETLSDEHMMDDDFFGYGVEELDELEYDDFFGDEDSLPGFNDLLHRIEDLSGVLGMHEPRPPPLVGMFYKTKLCRYYLRPGGCKEGGFCNFAHGEHELRHI